LALQCSEFNACLLHREHNCERDTSVRGIPTSRDWRHHNFLRCYHGLWGELLGTGTSRRQSFVFPFSAFHFKLSFSLSVHFFFSSSWVIKELRLLQALSLSTSLSSLPLHIFFFFMSDFWTTCDDFWACFLHRDLMLNTFLLCDWLNFLMFFLSKMR
jgi:hypothetical protein